MEGIMKQATAKSHMKHHVVGKMPQRPEMKVVRLSPLRKPRPAKATMKRVGIVPHAPHTPHLGPSAAQTADGIQFPPNIGETDTNVVSHGGSVAPGVPVQLIFWGNNWTTGDAALRDQLVAAALNLIEGGPFSSALGQYGLSGPTFRGTTTIISPEPPASFDDGSVGDIVWACIDQNIFPAVGEVGFPSRGVGAAVGADGENIQVVGAANHGRDHFRALGDDARLALLRPVAFYEHALVPTLAGVTNVADFLAG
jgi:hypothetical protein